MNSIVRRPWRRWSPLTVLAVLAAAGCSDLTGMPPDGNQIVSETVQTAFQLAAVTVYNNGHFPIVADAVDQTYISFGNITLNYHDTNDNLPAPDQPPYLSPNAPDWPDPHFYPDVYYNYAAAFRNTQYPYALFFANHFATNDTTFSCYRTSGDPYTWGVSNGSPGPNVVNVDRSQRWSFTFVTDMQAMMQHRCGDAPQLVEYALIHVVTHEYGHQRAGLTHNDFTTASSYHAGSVPSGRDDIMKAPVSFAELSQYPYPVFDRYQTDVANDHTTCRGNLLYNKSVQ